jgi:hypothetical protein
MSGMEEVPKNAKIQAFEAVLDRYDTEGLSSGELAEILKENTQSINNILRDMGYAKEVDSANMDKEAPQDLMRGFYNGEPMDSTTVNPEIAKSIEGRFSPDEVDGVDPSESASLGVFYGAEVESQASSNRGNAAHSSGNQAE